MRLVSVGDDKSVDPEHVIALEEYQHNGSSWTQITLSDGTKVHVQDPASTVWIRLKNAVRADTK